MNILEFKNVNIGYDYRYLVLQNINIKIKEGEHWCILGANGSGKSTFLKLISNDLYPNTHYTFTKKIFEKDTWDIFELKKHLGIVSNDLQNEFYYHCNNASAFELIRSSFYASLGKQKHHIYTKQQDEKTNEIIQYLNIEYLRDKKVRHMSTGELRKCLIARALIFDPKALLLDEPTSGLDIKAQREFLALMKKLSKKLTIIVITHHIEEIISEITNIALIAKNKIYKQGLKEDILTSQNISEVFDLPLELQSNKGRYFIK